MNHHSKLVGVGRDNLLRSTGLGFLLLAAFPIQTSAQTVLIDDFNDGNADGWVTIDRTVGRPWGPGTFDASSGALELEGGGLSPRNRGEYSLLGVRWEQSSDLIFSDGFIRAKVSVHETGGALGVWLRGIGDFLNEDSTTNYALIGHTAWNAIPGNGRFVAWRDGRVLGTLPGNLSFGVNEEWYIEAGAVGDQLSMKVWRVGDPEPESPQWTRTDRTLRTGHFGVAAWVHPEVATPERVSATFDDIYFTFPEHDDVFAVAPYNIYLWDAPMPVPQQEGPAFVDGSPEKSDMRGDVTTAQDWPDLRISGQVTDMDGQPIPGLKLDFWQVDDQGSYDDSGEYDLRGHLFTDDQGNYELWTVMPASYETVRSRHLHLKLGGENSGFDSPLYTTQLYFPTPYDNDINADGTPDKVVESGVLTDFDAIALNEDFITSGDLEAAGASYADLASNTLTLLNDPVVDGYFDTTLNIVMRSVFQAPLTGDYNGNGQLDAGDLDLQAAGMQAHDPAFDLDGDGDADFDDRLAWVRDLKETWIGDANLDGSFDSGDLIEVFQADKYEIDAANWADGDWTGDGRFGTADLVAAFQDGGYERGPRESAAAVPEPSGFLLFGLAFISLSKVVMSVGFRDQRRVADIKR